MKIRRFNDEGHKKWVNLYNEILNSIINWKNKIWIYYLWLWIDTNFDKIILFIKQSKWRFWIINSKINWWINKIRFKLWLKFKIMFDFRRNKRGDLRWLIK